MSYENATATKLLATHCCVCNRPLLDAVSVELGIGPDCRKKYMPKALGGEAREEANKLVYQLALAVSGIVTTTVTTDAAGAAYVMGGAAAVGQMLVGGTEAEGMLARLHTLGFDKLAEKLEAAWIAIRVTEDAGQLTVVTPYNAEAVDAMRRVPGRRWDPVKKVNTFPQASNSALWALLRRYYPGKAGIGPKGPFVVPAS
jgi:hypothetical protein